jgi:hypothetical protein
MAEGESDIAKWKDFNKDLGSYISSRKKRRVSFSSIFGSRRRQPAELPPDVKSYGDPDKKKKEEASKTAVTETVEDSGLEAEYTHELTHAERGVLSRVFGMFRSKPGHAEPAEQKVDEHGNLVAGGAETPAEIKTEFRDYEAEQMLGEKPLEERRGLFTGLATFLGLKAKSAPDYEEEIVGGAPEDSQISQTTEAPKTGTEVKSDMKDIAKISADILKKLDPKKLEEFKKTQDFEKFKEILKRHNMIR